MRYILTPVKVERNDPDITAPDVIRHPEEGKSVNRQQLYLDYGKHIERGLDTSSCKLLDENYLQDIGESYKTLL